MSPTSRTAAATKASHKMDGRHSGAMRRLRAAKRRAEEREHEAALAELATDRSAPLPAWLSGDTSSLPKAPPGRAAR